jgi:hypothetical protein
MSGYNPERAKALRDERRRNGICTTCGKRPAFGNYVSCEYCIEKNTVRAYLHRAANRERYNAMQRDKRRKELEAGKCSACHKPNPDLSRVLCPSCRARDHARYMRNYVHKVRPDGVCLRCDRPVEPGWKLCSVHRSLAAAAGEKGRAAQDRSRHLWRLDEQVRRSRVTV